MTRKGSETAAEVSGAMRDGEDRSSQQAAAGEAATAGKGGKAARLRPQGEETPPRPAGTL